MSITVDFCDRKCVTDSVLIQEVNYSNILSYYWQ